MEVGCEAQLRSGIGGFERGSVKMDFGEDESFQKQPCGGFAWRQIA